MLRIRTPATVGRCIAADDARNTGSAPSRKREVDVAGESGVAASEGDASAPPASDWKVDVVVIENEEDGTGAAGSDRCERAPALVDGPGPAAAPLL